MKNCLWLYQQIKETDGTITLKSSDPAVCVTAILTDRTINGKRIWTGISRNIDLVRVRHKCKYGNMYVFINVLNLSTNPTLRGNK